MKTAILLLSAFVFSAAPLMSDPADDFSKSQSRDNIRQVKFDPAEPGGATYSVFAVENIDRPGSLVYAVPEQTAQLKLATIAWGKICVEKQPPKSLLKIETSDDVSFTSPTLVEAKYELSRPNQEEGYLHFNVAADLLKAKFVRITMTTAEFGIHPKANWYLNIDELVFLPAL